MNRNFPPETIWPCDNCGRDLTLVELVEGGFEANDQRDYVFWDANSDVNDRVVVCAGCRAAVGMDE